MGGRERERMRWNEMGKNESKKEKGRESLQRKTNPQQFWYNEEILARNPVHLFDGHTSLTEVSFKKKKKSF